MALTDSRSHVLDGAPRAAADPDRLLRTYALADGPDDGRVVLVWFPYAGGSAAHVAAWPAHLPAGTGLVGVRYPGRERRLHDPHPASVAALATQVADALLATPGLVPRAVLWGHSLGALVALETARELERRGAAPRALVGEARDHVLALVRADARLARTVLDAATCGGPPPAISVPVVAATGDADPAARPEHLAEWARCTTGPTIVRTLPGGHVSAVAAPSAVVGLLADATGLAPRAPQPGEPLGPLRRQDVRP